MKVTFKPNMLNLLEKLKAEFYETRGYEPNTVVVTKQEYNDLIKEVKRCNACKSYVHYPFINKTQINGLFIEVEGIL
jgi:ribonuclease HIII